MTRSLQIYKTECGHCSIIFYELANAELIHCPFCGKELAKDMASVLETYELQIGVHPKTGQAFIISSEVPVVVEESSDDR